MTEIGMTGSGERLYPRLHPRRDKSGRPWRVEYDLLYDDGPHRWTGFYRSQTGARIAAFWNVHVGSWGGGATLSYQFSLQPQPKARQA